ncbi:ribonuclease h superfamily [Holotrichia oblita]|uniref:Ribonuclease h superfamily n=1 Tax=Holotrichia oblita TaxID=644536 RepID=A0ACB9SZE1_HOLOL|nr:ribonuclease h superfamily [Holotrichia oblita]
MWKTLKTWIKDNNSTKWTEGCYFIQWQKNSSYHRIIKQSPYKALFGVGLSSSSLPSEVIQDITSEEESENVIKTQQRQLTNEERAETDIHNSCAADTNGKEDIQVFEMSDIPIVQNTFDEIETNMNSSKNMESGIFCVKCNQQKSIDVQTVINRICN